MTRSTTRVGGGLLPLTAVLVALLLAACGGSDDDAGDTTTTTGDETTTTEASTSSTDDGDAAGADAWAASAEDHRGEDGTEVEFDCPPGGILNPIWGTETYTDDSSVCTAAVHVGLITVDEGGTVTIEIGPGEDAYVAGEANDVVSEYYPAFAGSFTFPDAPPGSGEFAVPASSWGQNATGLAVGDTRSLDCSPGGPTDSVWGTGTYTADSSICTAAVLEGRFSVEEGGSVTVVVTDGEDSYEGSTANGVTSSDYAAYDLSFEIEG